MTSPVKEFAPKVRRRRSSLKRQRRMILILLLVVAILAASFAVVYHFTSRAVFEDLDGTEYYVRQVEGVFIMEDEEGNELPRTSHSNDYATAYQTALGTIVSVDLTTGDFSMVAAVMTEGSEALEFSSYSDSFDILLYPMLERNAIKSIRVVNEKDSFAFLQTQTCTNTKCLHHGLFDEFPKDSAGKPSCPKCGSPSSRGEFQLEGFPAHSFDENLFATLVTCTGYTSTYMRLDREKVLQYGYGEYGLPQNPDEAKNYFIITDTAGNAHKVLIGDEVPAGTGYYAMYVGRPDVYILKEMEETQYSSTFSTVLLSPVETYVTPTVLDTMSSTDYFDVSNFKLNTVDQITEDILADPNFKIKDMIQNVITFSYIPIEQREGTLYSTTPYSGGGRYEGFAISDYMVDDCLQNLQYLSPLRTVKLFTNAENENLKGLFHFAKEYGIAYCVQYTHNLERDANKNFKPTKWVDQEIWISPLSEDGTYFLYNDSYQMIVEVDRSHLEFLHWDAFTWVDGDVFEGNIAYMQKIEAMIPGGLTTGRPGLTNLVFTLDNSASLIGWDPTDKTSTSIPNKKLKVQVNGVEELDTTQFRLFYQTLIYSSLSGTASCTQEQQEAFLAASQNAAGGYVTANGQQPYLVLKLTYNTEPDGSGETVVRTCVFYRYGGGRQCFMAFNGKGNFYMLQSRVDKIISDIGLLFTPETPIKPQAKT